MWLYCEQELASSLLWALALAYESTEAFAAAFVTPFDDAEEVRVDVPTPAGMAATTPTTCGIVVLSESILSKFASGAMLDCDVGALTSLLRCRLCDNTFLPHYGYQFVTKILDDIHQSAVSGAMMKAVIASNKESRDAVPFGLLLFYGAMLPRREKELLQLCRLAHSCLTALYRSTPSVVESVIPRTHNKVLCLLQDQDNAVILHHVLLCAVVHLKAQPLKCTELMDASMAGTILSLALEPSRPAPLRATAFTCLRLMLLDAKCLAKQFGLLEKLFDARQLIVSTLQDGNFDVKKQALVLAVDFVFRLPTERLVREVAQVFSESPENQTMLAQLFASLSINAEENPESGYVLQLLVRLVVRLDLTALTDTDQLVGAICMSLTLQSDSTFLRPLLFSCLCQVAGEAKHDAAFAKASRLDTITNLLAERLTLGELQSVSGLLLAVTTRHEGVRRYLQQAASGCIAQVCRVLAAFFQVSADGTLPTWQQAANDDEDVFGAVSADDSESRFVVKMTAGKRVFISHFTDAVYEQVRIR